ncbi:hypothetical protein HanPSC8_Chr04g0172981 [Helianthus annuus]|nr:hypothetical protein HanPSC8_Chr04g0172981 [Helianthus annuus]
MSRLSLNHLTDAFEYSKHLMTKVPGGNVYLRSSNSSSENESQVPSFLGFEHKPTKQLFHY